MKPRDKQKFKDLFTVFMAAMLVVNLMVWAGLGIYERGRVRGHKDEQVASQSQFYLLWEKFNDQEALLRHRLYEANTAEARLRIQVRALKELLVNCNGRE